MCNKNYLHILILVCLFLMPVSGFCKQKTRVKHLTSITGSEETGQFGLLGGVFFDEKKGRLYVTDSTNSRILAFDSDLKFVSAFTGGGALALPTSLVRDSLGRFFVAEPTKGHVLMIDMAQRNMEPMRTMHIF